MFEQPITYEWIHNEVCLLQGEKLVSVKVIGRSKDSDGKIVGSYDNNTFNNTMVYDV